MCEPCLLTHSNLFPEGKKMVAGFFVTTAGEGHGRAPDVLG
jgi:hypothetical protein